MQPEVSVHFQSREPSAIRLAQIRFAARRGAVDAVNTAIGNVSLPMHPAMQARMKNLGAADSPFAKGVVKYTATVGEAETNQAFLNIIASSGGKTEGLFSQITNGGSQAMELVVLGCCGAAGSAEKPLLLIDAAYTNYLSFANRLGRRAVSVARVLQPDGRFTLPQPEAIEAVIEREQPGALVVIPYDNPTGQLYSRSAMLELARLAVKHNLWIISDEAYRELHYDGSEAVSIWSIAEADVPGIEGRRIGIETSSKVWNACGLRIGALVTDNQTFHEKSVAENTADLCASAIGQYIFGGLAHESHTDLQAWYAEQRRYYGDMMSTLVAEVRERIPGIIMSRPDASIYSVVDVRDLVGPDFDAAEFVLHCAEAGEIAVEGRAMTLLVAPLAGFYSIPPGQDNPGRTQMRIAYVEPPERMALVPQLFEALLTQYLASS